MAHQKATPIIVGVGDVINRSRKVEDAIEPLQLMLQAIELALHDTKLPPDAERALQASIDSLDVIRTWTWPYADLPELLSGKLGIKPKHTYYSLQSGREIGKVLDEAARSISFGDAKVALITGGEALASLTACTAAKKLPPPGWTPVEQQTVSVHSPTEARMKQMAQVASIHGVGAPIHVYPLFENGLRAARSQTIEANNKESARLYAEFSKVAEKNPFAWNYGRADSAEMIGTITKRNRMICFPYPLLMNAFNTVNLAGAVILTSVEYARSIGIDRSRWIYPLGGAGTSDSTVFWGRPNFHSSPAISRSLDAALEASQLTKDQIDLYDFYSCFPIVPKLASYHLGLPITDSPTPITLLGGLTSFGGAGNNYSMHAINEMVRLLRKGQGRHGLVLANGGTLTYQHAVCLSSQPRKNGSPYPAVNPLPEITTDIPIPILEENPEGEAFIETYTVEYHRDGRPMRGYIVGRVKDNGHRFIANPGDDSSLQQLASRVKEPIGRTGRVRRDAQVKGRNLFTFDSSEKL